MPNESDSKPVNPLYIIAALLDNHGGDIGLAQSSFSTLSFSYETVSFIAFMHSP